ncbi:cytochrome c biogenesis heme-transporting ATPase CcmA [Alteromonas salexigens]|uniref:cytochrome c biogenesis heme-transporting ATPase CcmA n=1 Tax=Alteromonas salexigens TaxID=2982530 RepID=UPI003570BA17
MATSLTCIKRDRVLFENLNLQLQTGELMYLRGPNGAGKTSLLRLLTGLSMPEAGEVTFNHAPVQHSESQFYRQSIYLGHKSGLSSALSALDNLTYWCAQHQVTVTESQIVNVLDVVGVTGLEDIPVAMLSAGQQRRVALARLWLKPARFWVLDEPFTALDTAGVALLETTFKKHVDEGGAIITTSHQPLSARAGTHRYFDLEYRF